jgi:RND family efflux transporter MFP subunit
MAGHQGFMKYWSNISVPVVTAALLLLQACSEDTRQTPGAVDRTVPVVVAPLQLDHARTRLEAVGTSRALQSIELHPATSGEVIAVNFQPGQRVSAGDVLVELERRDEQLALSLAEVQLQDAERLYERYQRTGSSGAVLPTQMDAARTAVEAARIQIERARVALDYRTIEAPFDGYVGITEVDRGDRINPDTIITTLDNRDSLLVSFSVPETLIGELAVGDDVSISTWNSRSPTATGRVVDIGSRISPATRTFEARASVDNKPDELRPGMSFRVSMNLEGTAYPVITETAVQWGADGAYIWTVVDGQARRVPVSVVQRQQGVVLVDAPLDAGDLVVIEGIQRLRNGLEVDYEPPKLADQPLHNDATADEPRSN